MHYNSKEMFLVQELKDKSDTILGNISNNSIEKAILLEMGQPKLLIMDFQKYEEFFLEYQVLKKNQNNNPNSISNTVKKESKNEEIIQEEIKDIKKEHFKEELKSIESIVTVANKVNDIYFPTAGQSANKIQNDDSVEEDDSLEELNKDEKEMTEEEEIQQALDKIKSIDFDANMRRIAETKIREKILKARKIRLQEQKKDELNQEEITTIDNEEDKIEENISMAIPLTNSTTNYKNNEEEIEEEEEQENNAPILEEFASSIQNDKSDNNILNDIEIDNNSEFTDENLENNIKQKQTKALNDFWN